MNARTQTFELSRCHYNGLKKTQKSNTATSRISASEIKINKGTASNQSKNKEKKTNLQKQRKTYQVISEHKVENKTEKQKLTVEGRQVDEAVASIFHTVLFHRSLGKFSYKQEGSYSVGTVGYEDVDCDFIDFTYVCCSSENLDRTLKKEISGFSEALRENDGPRSGQISLEFFQKKKNVFWTTECIPWEVWNVRLQLIKLTNEYERQLCREKLGDLLTDKILYIAEVMNKHEYVPKMPNQSELDLIFDTTYPDVQPYLFKLSFATSGPTNSSVGKVKKMIRESLPF